MLIYETLSEYIKYLNSDGYAIKPGYIALLTF